MVKTVAAYLIFSDKLNDDDNPLRGLRPVQQILLMLWIVCNKSIYHTDNIKKNTLTVLCSSTVSQARNPF